MPDYSQIAPELEMPAPTPIAEERVPRYEIPRYSSAPSVRCRVCSQFIYNYFYRLNGQKVCATCAEMAKSGESAASRGSLLGAVVFGFGGALLGMLLYSAVLVVVGPHLGYLVMILGWIVGKTALAGADGVGGSRIQIVSVALTYFAIALAGFPAQLYTAFQTSGFFAGWGGIFVEVPRSLAAPVAGLRLESLQSVVDVSALLYLLVGMLVAWGLTRVKRQTVAGPFDLSTV